MARGRAGDGCDVGTNMCAYIMLLTTGCCGGHHAYLGRQYQALTWSISCGGCGVGLLRDALYIPRYVRESSGEESENIRQMQLLTPKPPLSFDRVAFQAALTFTLAWVGALAALDMSASAPEARVSSALGAFLGAYLVGSIGTQECSALHTAGGTLIGAVASLAMPGYEVASVVVGALAGALATRAHRPLPQQSPCGRRGCCARFGLLGAFAATFWLAASVAVLQHGTMTVGDPPVPVKLGEYVRENWSEWAELYREVNEHLKNSGQTWGDLFGEVLDRVTSSDDKHFTTLELEPGASWDEVKKAYKRMARKYHPDKVRGGEEEVAAAAEKFMAAQKAYEALGVSMGQSRKAAAAAEEEKATRFQGFSAGSRASNDPPKSTKQPRKPRKSKRRRPKSEL